jgi:hypothetical protein
MKEQNDMKQDFDRWFTRQFVEEEYVPTSLERNVFLQKFTTHKRWKKRVKVTWTAIALLACMGLLYSTSSNKEGKKKNTFIPEKQPPFKRMNKEKESVQLIIPLIPVQAQFFDQLNPTIFNVQDNKEDLEISLVERAIYREDPFPIAFIQEVDLDSVMKNFGIFFLQSSTSNQGRNFSGVTSGHELVVASVVNGSMYFPNAPDTSSSTGGFRPIGMAGNQYVHYSFYDVRQLLFNEAIYRQVLAVNVLPRIAYYMRTAAPGWNNPVNVHTYQDLPRSRTNAQVYQDQNIQRISGQSELKNQFPTAKSSRPFYLRQNVRVNNMAKTGLLIGDNFLIKSQGQKVLVVSCDAERVSLVKEDGVIEASHSINIAQPRFFSQKAKYPFYDEESQRLFLIVETNFAYMWFEVNQLTGETRYIFKTETIWNDPNWAIKDGTLFYMHKGKSYQKRLD